VHRQVQYGCSQLFFIDGRNLDRNVSADHAIDLSGHSAQRVLKRSIRFVMPMLELTARNLG